MDMLVSWNVCHVSNCWTDPFFIIVISTRIIQPMQRIHLKRQIVSAVVSLGSFIGILNGRTSIILGLQNPAADTSSITFMSVQNRVGMSYIVKEKMTLRVDGSMKPWFQRSVMWSTNYSLVLYRSRLKQSKQPQARSYSPCHPVMSSKSLLPYFPSSLDAYLYLRQSCSGPPDSPAGRFISSV